MLEYISANFGQFEYADQALVFREDLCSNNSSRFMSIAVLNTLYVQKPGAQAAYLVNED